jgi:hypothetical protein
MTQVKLKEEKGQLHLSPITAAATSGASCHPSISRPDGPWWDVNPTFLKLGWDGDRKSGVRNSGRNSAQEWAIPDQSQEFQVQELPNWGTCIVPSRHCQWDPA